MNRHQRRVQAAQERNEATQRRGLRAHLDDLALQWCIAKHRGLEPDYAELSKRLTPKEVSTAVTRWSDLIVALYHMVDMTEDDQKECIATLLTRYTGEEIQRACRALDQE